LTTTLCLITLVSQLALSENLTTPSISVTANYKVESMKDEPGMESAHTYYEWDSAYSDYVLILGKDSKHYPTKGRISASGSLLFVAIGKNGQASQAVGASLSMRPGPGRHGIIYSFSKDFNPESFFQNSYKEQCSITKSVKQLEDSTVRVLQAMNYIADTTKSEYLRSGKMVYTVNFNSNKYLQQTQEDLKLRGKIERKIAYVVYINQDRQTKVQIYVMPIIKRNFPRDNAEWDDDPDALGMGISACKDLVKSILENA